MRITTDITEINTLLAEYKGGDAKIFLFSTTFVRLCIRIKSAQHEEVIYLIGVGSEFIKGFFSWRNVNISVSVHSTEYPDEHLYKILDSDAEFELLTNGGITLAIGFEREFGPTLANFISFSDEESADQTDHEKP